MMKKMIQIRFFMLFLAMIITFPSMAEKATATWTAAVDAQITATLAKIGQQCCIKVEQLAESLNKDKFLKLEVESSFYDPVLRRVFVAFRGEGLFTGDLPVTVPESGWFVTGDGALAYDLAITEPAQVEEGTKFKINGTAVVFLEKIILELSSLVAGTTGVPVVKEAAMTLLLVVEKIDCGLVAKSMNDLFSSFSPENMKALGDKITKSGKAAPGLAKEIGKAVKSGKALDYLRLSLVHNSVGTIAGVAGGSLGAVLGSVIIPGPIGAVSGYIVGTCTLRSVAKGVVYKFSVKMPIDRSLKRIANANKDKEKMGATSLSIQGSGANGQSIILEMIRAEFKRKQFTAFDYTLESIDSYKPSERQFFVSLIKQLQSDILRKITVEADWFFAKKYYQLKAKAEAWKLTDLVPFTAAPPVDGKPQRQPQH